jgi:hypothetical protein
MPLSPDSAIDELIDLGIRYDTVVGGVPTPTGSMVGFTPLMQKVIAYRAIESINAHYGTGIPFPCLADSEACQK